MYKYQHKFQSLSPNSVVYKRDLVILLVKDAAQSTSLFFSQVLGTATTTLKN